MTTGKVVGSIFFATDQLLRMEELAVGASSNLINDSWLKIYEHGTWHVLSSTSLAEEGVESIVSTANGLVARHLPIRLCKNM